LTQLQICTGFHNWKDGAMSFQSTKILRLCWSCWSCDDDFAKHNLYCTGAVEWCSYL